MKENIRNIVNMNIKIFLILSVVSVILLTDIDIAMAGTLNSTKVTNAPTIDGIPETIWQEVQPMTIKVSNGANTGSHDVTLKSIYTEDSIYFLAQWNDPTASIRREPWIKQENGTWIQLKDPDDKGGDNNKYYEDKFAQIWNINISGFENTGCFITCHIGEIGKPYGNKYTRNPGEIGDIWHAKIVRNNPVGTIDDQYLDSTRYDINKSPDAGRKSDPGNSSYYSNIENNTPRYTSKTQPAQLNKIYWILDSEKEDFKDIYKVNDEIAGIMVRNPTGDREDIKSKAVYNDGKWTLEYGRKLVTGSQYDVQFSDLKKEYFFGTAVFDNAQVRHSYESGVSKLVFEIKEISKTPIMTPEVSPKETPKSPSFEAFLTISILLLVEIIILIKRK